MKHLLFTLLIAGLFLTMSSSYRGNDLFQVISSHPHDLEEMNPYIETVHQRGRLWIVQLKKVAPEAIMDSLRPLSGREKHYFYQGMFISNKSKKNKINIKSYTSEVKVENLRRDIEELASYETRFVGTPENQQVLESAASRLQEMGYSIEEHCYRGEVCSVIAEKIGKEKTNDIIMVMGHIDSVGESFAGADDNASGAAVLFEMARILKNYDNKKTIRFFITNGEEAGLIGSSHYARKLEATGEIKNIKLALNLDMVGYNANGVVELETSPDHENLARSMADLASRFTTLKTKITLGAWGSDHMPFLSRGVPALLSIEDWDTKNPCYHQECDRTDLINLDYVAEIAKLNLSAVLAKDLDLQD